MNPSVYKRPNKPDTMFVTRRKNRAPTVALNPVPEVVTVDKYTECHVTPLDVARRMVDYLKETQNMLTLEPSAGTGNLLQALFENNHSACELVAIERHGNLCNEIRKRFKNNEYINPINECFLEYAQRAAGQIEYPRIIMNPPFKQIRQHMTAALNLLGPAEYNQAILVALVPITYQHDEAETLETLGPDTFATAKVHTKIIRIER